MSLTVFRLSAAFLVGVLALLATVLYLSDYYTGEQHAHVNDIVVTAEAEGKGLGKLLLAKADAWAKDKRARWITLNVFNENFRARSVYEKAGYKIEWIKYLKNLRS